MSCDPCAADGHGLTPLAQQAFDEITALVDAERSARRAAEREVTALRDALAEAHSHRDELMALLAKLSAALNKERAPNRIPPTP